jgi:hypothetical protein
VDWREPKNRRGTRGDRVLPVLGFAELGAQRPAPVNFGEALAAWVLDERPTCTSGVKPLERFKVLTISFAIDAFFFISALAAGARETYLKIAAHEHAPTEIRT